ncbi:MAG: SAM-dependent methyltransferase [Bacteroidetes bacterium GWF2_42_66]|nr:MAG: SAM-dependent methyltransferase [Bacteroidetes bacterium GWA2_42_15]OFX97687.1 MAG: SAM-dependent methyltransferase [Bacteroidetes bacterium GWE2_42_39]OFY46935.1 MAG: SAM-dependent methyltransferase [Bacteroidetes bacterium GWF2_42_66]HBL75699.1 SAM-dependent methyltransferase [Prolixibacteraceae bacterium]HCR91784.1 SAM-dependent methyltransferase [Prolixibacteraceae bacterium]
MSKIYLIPTTLGESRLETVLPSDHKNIIVSVSFFIVENIRTARRFLKLVDKDIDIDRLTFFELNQHTKAGDLHRYLEPLKDGHDIGIISEAGCPGIADPGADIVRIAHEKNIRVVPLVGPSSILLSLMASGLNGQNFAFNGYLPIKEPAKSKTIKMLESRVYAENQSQLFIEAPYRNLQLFADLIHTCDPKTLLCVAADITLETEFILTKPVSYWRKNQPDIQKRPAIFIIGK